MTDPDDVRYQHDEFAGLHPAHGHIVGSGLALTTGESVVVRSGSSAALSCPEVRG